jgi:hypothetical protein
MASSYKVLGQSRPEAGTLTDIYTVPSSTEAVISTITLANMGPTATNYRVAIAKDGAATGINSMEQYLVYDTTIPPLDSLALTLGITLNAADVIRVESYSGLVAFQVFGSEIV